MREESYNLPRRALSIPPPLPVLRGVWNQRRPQAARPFFSQRTSGYAFRGKCELEGGTCSPGSSLLPCTLCLFIQITTDTFVHLLHAGSLGRGYSGGALPLGLPGSPTLPACSGPLSPKEPIWLFRAWKPHLLPSPPFPRPSQEAVHRGTRAMP